MTAATVLHSANRLPLLNLLCGWLTAAHQGRTLNAACAAALLDPATDLVGLARLAGRHCITPMLAAGISDPELRSRLPQDFALYLEFVHARNRDRNDALRRQLGQVAKSLNDIGIEPLLLKGAIRLVDGVYPDIGWRFMRDLDLLVPRDCWPEAVERLASLGYGFTRAAASWPEDHKHLPPLGRDAAAAVVEIHGDLLSERQEFCPAGQVMARSQPVDLGGARVRVPHPVDQLAVLIGHDRCDGYLRRTGMFLLRSVFEAAVLCRERGCVDELVARAAGAGLAHDAQVWLGLANRLFPDYVERHIDAELRARMKARALVAVERFDANGRCRRLVWFARLRAGKLLRSPIDRRHLAANILSPQYARRSLQRLHRLWATD